MMVRTRWRRSGLLLIGLLMAIAWMAGAQEETVSSDLYVSQLTVSPDLTVVQGSLVQVTALLSVSGAPLQGNIQAEISWRRVDKQEPCGTTWDTIQASGESGWEAELSAWIDTSDLTPGLHEIILLVDPENWIPESNESNNRVTATLTVRSPQPELHPTQLISTPFSPLAWGETTTVRTTIENSGELAAGTFHVEFSVFPIGCYDPEAEVWWTIAPIVAQSETGSIASWSIEQSPYGLDPSALDAFPAEVWIPYETKLIAGLSRDQSVAVEAVFATGQLLRDLLMTSSTGGLLASSSIVPLTTSEMDLLERCVTSYALRVVVTAPEGALELDPWNNELRSSIAVEPSTLELAELLPVKVEFDEDLPLDWDGDVDVEVTVTNRGGQAAPTTIGATSITVSFYYRALGESGWTHFDTQTIRQLGAEEDTNTDTVETTVDADQGQLGLAPGSYELRIVVDAANLIEEQNEDNNELVVGFSVQGAELHPVTLDLPSDPVHQGDTITVVALVENTGDRSQRDFTTGFFFDDVRFDTFYYQAVQATDEGLERNKRVRVQGELDTTDLPPGVYSLRVVTDPDNQILEWDEGNNVIKTTLRILPPEARLAELHVTDLALDPTSPIPMGAQVTLAADIRNDGRIAAETFAVGFYFEYSTDGVTWTAPVSTLDQGTVFSRTRQIYGLSRFETLTVREILDTTGWPIGIYRLAVVVDVSQDNDGGVIPELDEYNNRLTALFSIGEPSLAEHDADAPYIPPGSAANLAFRSIAITPEGAVDVGDSVSIQAIVENMGAMIAERFTVALHWITPTGATYQLLSQRIDSLGPGQVWTLPETSVQTALPMGTYTIVGILDAENIVLESNESDNEFRAALAVGEAQALQADLIPTAVRYTPSSGVALAGQDMLAHVTIHNQGPLAAGPFAVAASWATGSATETVRGLSPLESTEITFTIPSPSAGDDSIVIVVDAASEVPESNELNNQLAEAFSITGVQLATSQLLFQEGAAPIALQLDGASGTLYAAFANGRIWEADRTGNSNLVMDTGQALTTFVRATGMRTIGYLGTASGSVLAVDLATGEQLLASDSLGNAVRTIAVDASNALYVLTTSTVAKLDGTLALVQQASMNGAVDAALDATGNTLYVLSTNGLFSLDSQLTVLCTLAAFSGTPTTMALGSSGVFVGTDAGVVHAVSLCASYTGTGPMMLASWRYPIAGTLGSAVTTLVIDERDIDPIYLTTADGRAISLSFTGSPFWAFEAGAGIGALPAVDARSGRLFLGDELGQPYVLGTDGLTAFEIGATASAGSEIQGNVIVDEVRRQTETGTKLIRIYYYGASNGGVYKFESTR